MSVKVLDDDLVDLFLHLGSVERVFPRRGVIVADKVPIDRLSDLGRYKSYKII